MATVANGLDVLLNTPEQAAAPAGTTNGLDVLFNYQGKGQVSPPSPVVPPGILGTVGNNILDAKLALLHHAMNFAHGTAQFAENVGAGLAQRIAPDSSVANAIGKVAMSDDAAMAAREAGYQSSVPNSAGSYIGATVGEVLPFIFGGGLQKTLTNIGKIGTEGGNYVASKIPQIDAAARLVGKVAGGALQGGAISAVAPVTSGDYLNTKQTQVPVGAAVGGAVPLVAGALSSAYNAGKGLLSPFTNPKSIAAKAATNLVAGNSSAPNQLLNAPEYVPGSIPTAAQAAPSPQMIQAEKTLANNPALKPQFVQRELDNNAARIAAVESVAGPPGALEAAKAERARVAKNLYGWAFDHPATPDQVTPWVKGQITQLTKRPAIQQAMKQAKVLAQNEGLKLTDATSIQGLHYAKTALDDQISQAFNAGNNNQARILIGTRDKLLTLMDKLSPTYAQARVEFAAASRPVNTMEVANELLDKLRSGSFDAAGMPKVNYSGYKSALSKALGNSEFGIDPNAQAVLEGVQKDLQRATASNAIRVPGSDTAFNLQAPGWLARHVYGADYSGPTRPFRIAGMMVGSALAPGHTLAGLATGGSLGYMGAGKLGNLAAGRVNSAMAQAMLNPNDFAGLLRSAESGNPEAHRILGLLSNRGGQAAAYSVARQSRPAP